MKFIAAFNALILDNIKTSRAEMASLMPLAGATALFGLAPRLRPWAER